MSRRVNRADLRRHAPLTGSRYRCIDTKISGLLQDREERGTANLLMIMHMLISINALESLVYDADSN